MGAQATDVVTEARGWIGTRWHHQASVKGVGVDCAGLVLGVGLNLGLFSVDLVLDGPETRELFAYGREPTSTQSLAGCQAFLSPIDFDALQLGDVVLLTFNGQASHLAILGDYPSGGHSLIHAYAQARRVVENRFDESWVNRFASAWRYPGIEAIA